MLQPGALEQRDERAVEDGGAVEARQSKIFFGPTATSQDTTINKPPRPVQQCRSYRSGPTPQRRRGDGRHKSQLLGATKANFSGASSNARVALSVHDRLPC